MAPALRDPVGMSLSQTRSSSLRPAHPGARLPRSGRAAASAVVAVAVVGGLLALATPAAAQDAPTVVPADDTIEVVLTDESVTVNGTEVEGALAPDGSILEPLSFSQCLSGNVCVWSGTGYTGDFANTTSTSAANTGILTARSVANRSTKAARVYSGTGGSGSSVCLNPGDQSSSLSIGSQSMRILTVTSC